MHAWAGRQTHTHKIAASALRSPELLAQIYLKLSKWNRKYVYIYMIVYLRFQNLCTILQSLPVNKVHNITHIKSTLL
jgi:uncharacterized membrane protein